MRKLTYYLLNPLTQNLFRFRQSQLENAGGWPIQARFWA